MGGGGGVVSWLRDDLAKTCALSLGASWYFNIDSSGNNHIITLIGHIGLYKQMSTFEDLALEYVGS